MEEVGIRGKWDDEIKHFDLLTVSPGFSYWMLGFILMLIPVEPSSPFLIHVVQGLCSLSGLSESPTKSCNKCLSRNHRGCGIGRWKITKRCT